MSKIRNLIIVESPAKTKTIGGHTTAELAVGSANKVPPSANRKDPTTLSQIRDVRNETCSPSIFSNGISISFAVP